MITVYVELVVREKANTLEGRKSFVRYYNELPWPRLHMAGDTFYLNAPDIFSDVNVPVQSVCFHPDNGNVIVELQPEEVTEGLLEHIDQLTRFGFAEVVDPYAVFEGKEP